MSNNTFTPAGRYRTLVEIWQTPQPDTVDGYGEERRVAEKLTTRLAAIRPLSGQEIFIARANDSQITHEVAIRYDPDLVIQSGRAEMRTVVGGRVFELGPQVDVEEARIEWRFQAIERTQ